MFRRWFRNAVLARPWATFVVMVLTFMGFGAGTLNLFFLFKANVELLLEHGSLVLFDGALAQLAELLVTAALSMAAYVVFKACEHRLVHGLVDGTPSRPVSSTPPSSSPNHEDRHPPR